MQPAERWCAKESLRLFALNGGVVVLSNKRRLNHLMGTSLEGGRTWIVLNVSQENGL
jgi:hypothetical protein